MTDIELKQKIRDGHRLYWDCTMGYKSHLNLLGRICLFPLALSMFVLLEGMDILFRRKNRSFWFDP